MTRRTAVQSLIAVIAGAMDPKQKTTTATKGTFRADWNKPPNLSISLDGWKEIVVHYGGETVTLDRAELFKALKGNTR